MVGLANGLVVLASRASSEMRHIRSCRNRIHLSNNVLIRIQVYSHETAAWINRSGTLLITSRKKLLTSTTIHWITKTDGMPTLKMIKLVSLNGHANAMNHLLISRATTMHCPLCRRRSEQSWESDQRLQCTRVLFAHSVNSPRLRLGTVFTRITISRNLSSRRISHLVVPLKPHHQGLSQQVSPPQQPKPQHPSSD